MRNILLKIDNYLLYLATCLMIGSGVVLEFRLENQHRAHGLSILGLNRHGWAELHFYFALAFMTLAISHLVVNWSWIMKVATRGNRLVLCLSLLVGMAIIVIPFFAPITTALISGSFEE